MTENTKNILDGLSTFFVLLSGLFAISVFVLLFFGDKFMVVLALSLSIVAYGISYMFDHFTQ